MPGAKRRSLSGMGAETFFGTPDPAETQEKVPPLDSGTVKQSDRETVKEEEEQETNEDQVVKTSFYPMPAQLDKLDDLAAEYNRIYRRKRPRINRNHIVRFLIDLVDIDMLDELNPKP